jgi:hypothetical protein
MFCIFYLLHLKVRLVFKSLKGFIIADLSLLIVDFICTLADQYFCQLCVLEFIILCKHLPDCVTRLPLRISLDAAFDFNILFL